MPDTPHAAQAPTDDPIRDHFDLAAAVMAPPVDPAVVVNPATPTSVVDPVHINAPSLNTQDGIGEVALTDVSETSSNAATTGDGSVITVEDGDNNGAAFRDDGNPDGAGGAEPVEVAAPAVVDVGQRMMEAYQVRILRGHEEEDLVVPPPDRQPHKRWMSCDVILSHCAAAARGAAEGTRGATDHREVRERHPRADRQQGNTSAGG